VIAAAALPATAAARTTPPYKVDSPAIEKSRVHAGDRLALGATVRPTGTHTQRRVMVAFLVSRDGRWDRGDKVIAKRRISRLGMRPRRVRARPTLDAPAGGNWHVIVCAGPQRGFPRRSRSCDEAAKTVRALPARAGKRPRRPAPAPAAPQAPRFLGATTSASRTATPTPSPSRSAGGRRSTTTPTPTTSSTTSTSRAGRARRTSRTRPTRATPGR
jgi:hypothetical protein